MISGLIDFLTGFGFIFIGLIIATIIVLVKKDTKVNRYVRIDDIPEKIIKSFKHRHKEFSDKDVSVLVSGLVDFFNLKIFRDKHIKNKKLKGEFKLEMISESVDLIWHEFILNTKEYTEFNKKFFNSFLNHIPHVDINEKEREKNETEMIDLLKYAIIKGVIKGDTKLLYADEEILKKKNTKIDEVKKVCSEPVSLWSGVFLLAFAETYEVKTKKSSDGGGDSGTISSTSNSDGGSDGGCSSCGGCGD